MVFYILMLVQSLVDLAISYPDFFWLHPNGDNLDANTAFDGDSPPTTSYVSATTSDFTIVPMFLNDKHLSRYIIISNHIINVYYSLNF